MNFYHPDSRECFSGKEMARQTTRLAATPHAISRMMQRFFLSLVLVILGTVSAIAADDAIREVQTRLKQAGFISGK